MIDSSILYTQLQQLIFLACEFKVDCKVSFKGFKLSYVQILVRIHGLSQVKINNCVRIISFHLNVLMLLILLNKNVP